MRVTSQDDVKKLGRIMGIWAHPDDETWASAGIMAIARKNQQPVCCIYATKGELGNQNPDKWPTNQLSSIREKELHAALKILGVDCHHWLGYKDGDCQNIPDAEAIAKIIPIIQEFQPDTILTFGPTGTTGHYNHVAVSSWATRALQQLKLKNTRLFYDVVPNEWYEQDGKRLDEQFDIFFNLETPPLAAENDIELCITLPEEILALKLEALRAQTSQTKQLFIQTNLTDIDNMAKTECFSLASF